jgi:glycosyltransferase involved in cell wall biosynthesis
VRHGESGVLVPFGDVAAFAREFLRLRQDEAWRNHLRAGALRSAALFDWDASANTMADVLEKAAETGRINPS